MIYQPISKVLKIIFIKDKQRYLSALPPTGQAWHKAFFKVGPSADAPSIPKNASGPVSILLKRGTSGDRQ